MFEEFQLDASSESFQNFLFRFLFVAFLIQQIKLLPLQRSTTRYDNPPEARSNETIKPIWQKQNFANSRTTSSIYRDCITIYCLRKMLTGIRISAEKAQDRKPVQCSDEGASEGFHVLHLL